MNIAKLFYSASTAHPNKIALVEKDKSITFSQLGAEVDATAAYFLSKGISKGDRVLVFVPMSIGLYRVVLALFKIGAVAVFLDEWVNKERREICCCIANCKGFIAPFKIRMMGMVSRAIRSIPVKLRLNGRVISQPKDLVECGYDDSALITFTTGSTGIPKAADRSHGFLLEQFRSLQDTIQPKEGDIDMPVLPVVLLMNLGAGCTSVIADWKASKPAKFDPEKIIDQVTKNKIIRITASPFFLLKLGKHVIEKKIFLPVTIEKIFTGGAPVFPADAGIFLQAFPGTRTTIVYGSTEAEPISEISAEELFNSRDEVLQGISVGTIYKNTEVKIIPLRAGSSVVEPASVFSECVPGSIGEIIVSGPHVLKKYFNNPEAFKQNKIVDGEKIWHRTGDSGFIDTKGNLFLTGRCTTLFYDNKKLISPFLMEGYLKNIENVEIGTVLKHNEKIYLFVELKDNADKRVVEEKIKGAGINYSSVIYCTIPRDPRHFSKVDYAKLIAQHNSVL